MAITRLGGANAITGTLPAANINDTSISNITALPAGVGGEVLQVVNGNVGSTDIVNTDAYIGSGLSITPSSTSSKIQIFVNGYAEQLTGSVTDYPFLYLHEATTQIATLNNAMTYQYTVGARITFSINFIRSPSTTSAIQYRLYHDEQIGGASYRYYEQFWTLMEIAG